MDYIVQTHFVENKKRYCRYVDIESTANTILIVLYHYCVCSGSNINQPHRDKSIKNFAIVFGTLFATIAQISNKQLNFSTTDCHIFVKWSLKREEQESYHNSRLIYFLRPWVSKYHAN